MPGNHAFKWSLEKFPTSSIERVYKRPRNRKMREILTSHTALSKCLNAWEPDNEHRHCYQFCYLQGQKVCNPTLKTQVFKEGIEKRM